MTYYRISRYRSVIEPVEFQRVTEHFGFLPNGQRHKLRSDWEDYYSTREQAVNAIYKRLIHQNKMAIEQQKKCESDLTDFVVRENLAGEFGEGKDA